MATPCHTPLISAAVKGVARSCQEMERKWTQLFNASVVKVKRGMGGWRGVFKGVVRKEISVSDSKD
jgi:hypothetical protein